MKRLLKWLAGLAIVLTAAFALLRTPDTDPAAMKAKYGTPQSQYLAMAGGLTLHLRDEGPRDAPVIVLLHGLSADTHLWDPWARTLAQQYRVIRYDQIGHGLTGTDPRGDYSRAGQLARLEELVDRLALKRFVLVGSSMGGDLALAYAIRHGERLQGLALLDPGGVPVEEKAKGNIGFTLAATPGISWLAERITPRALIAKSVHQTLANQAAVSDAMIDRYWEMLRYPGNRAAMMTKMALPRTPHTAQQLAALRVPVLVQWGDRDALIPVSAGRFLGATVPGARLVIYPGVGHLPMEEIPERSLADFTKWLEPIARTGRADLDAPPPRG
jgi:pimeloyl-ACP methyl ester carboxylesterase